MVIFLFFRTVLIRYIIDDSKLLAKLCDVKKLSHVTHWPLPSNGRINSLTVSVLALQVSGFLPFVFT
jgi:hypothetical protein